MRIRSGWWAAALVLAFPFGGPARAWIPLADGEKGKLEVETRVMFWGTSTDRDPTAPGGPAQDEEVQDFFLRRGRILFRAQASSRLEIFTQFGQDNAGSAGSADEGSLRVKDLYLNYAFRDRCQLTVGQFRVPFLRQNLESGFSQLLVDRAALTTLRPAREGSRDVGGMLWGNLGGFQYRAALFDGSDQEDGNPRGGLRGTARASYNWFTREPGFGYTGTTLGQKQTLQVGAQLDAQGDRADPKDDAGFTTLLRDYRAWAVDLFFERPFRAGWSLTLEGSRLGRRDDYEDPTQSTRSMTAYYAQAGILLPARRGRGRLQLTARHERIGSRRGGISTHATRTLAGATWFLSGHDRKIQLDYGLVEDQLAALESKEIRLSLVAVF